MKRLRALVHRLARRAAIAGFAWLCGRLAERSSAAAIAGLLVMLVGVHVAPARGQEISTAVSIGLSLVAFVTREAR